MVKTCCINNKAPAGHHGTTSQTACRLQVSSLSHQQGTEVAPVGFKAKAPPPLIKIQFYFEILAYRK